MTEECAACGATVPFSAAVHLLVHTGEEGVRDGYVCRSCYEREVEPLIE